MSKKNDSVDQESVLTPAEHMASLLYQFMNLYERWSEDRQVAAKQGYDTAQFLKAFAEEVRRFSSLEQNVRESIDMGISRAFANAVQDVSQTISEAATLEMNATLKRLEDSVMTAEQSLAKFKGYSFLTHWKIVLFSLLSMIATCFFMLWFLMPRAVLSDWQLGNCELGNQILEVWPMLNKDEKHWIENQIEEKAKGD